MIPQTRRRNGDLDVSQESDTERRLIIKRIAQVDEVVGSI